MFDYTSYQLHSADLLRVAAAERRARRVVEARRDQRHADDAERRLRVHRARWARAA